jgi:hypothetical protein
VISLVTSPSEGEVPTGFLDKLRTDPDEAIAPDVRRLALAVIGLLYLAIGALVFSRAWLKSRRRR